MPTNTTPWHACHCIALFIPYSANHPGSIHRLLLQESANRGRLPRFLIENLPPYRMPHDRNSFDAEACSADSQLPPSPHRTEIDEDDSGTRNTDSLGHASALHRAARELSARLLTWRVTVGRGTRPSRLRGAACREWFQHFTRHRRNGPAPRPVSRPRRVSMRTSLLC